MKFKNKLDKTIKHIKRWCIWNKRCKCSRIHKFLVLIGVRKDIACTITCLPGELDHLSAKNTHSVIDESQKTRRRM